MVEFASYVLFDDFVRWHRIVVNPNLTSPQALNLGKYCSKLAAFVIGLYDVSKRVILMYDPTFGSTALRQHFN